MFKHVGRVGRTAIIAGLLIASASGAALIGSNHGASAAAPSAVANAARTAPAAASAAAHGRQHGWSRGGGRRAGGRGPGAGLGKGLFMRRMIPILKVTSVGSTSISATAANGRAVTIDISSTTAYTEAGNTVSLSAVQQGSIIRVKGTRSGQATIQASAIVIELPRVAGVVTNVSSSTLTVTGMDGLPHTINADSSNTKVSSAGQAAALTDIKVGSTITAEGKLNGDGSLSAARITIRLPHVAGAVTKVDGSTITVTNFWGETHIINTSSSTIFATRDGVTATLSSVTPGERIVAQGTLGSDNQTINATRIRIMPARGAMGSMGGSFGSGPGPGKGGSFGFGPSTGSNTGSSFGTGV